MKGGVRLLGPSGERKREKETQRDTEREREGEIEWERQREREIERARERGRENQSTNQLTRGLDWLASKERRVVGMGGRVGSSGEGVREFSKSFGGASPG